MQVLMKAMENLIQGSRFYDQDFIRNQRNMNQERFL
jgi:hypothetical protein